MLLSAPSGAWVSCSRAPYGARGLKLLILRIWPTVAAGRAPYGARGLKYLMLPALLSASLVAPRTGRVD